MSSPGYPRFAPAAVLVVDHGNGSETWTGAEWNEYVERAERTQSMVMARLIECPDPAPVAAARDNVLMCGAYQPVKRNPYRCTEPYDHPGRHRAEIDGETVAQWSCTEPTRED